MSCMFFSLRSFLVFARLRMRNSVCRVYLCIVLLVGELGSEPTWWKVTLFRGLRMRM